MRGGIVLNLAVVGIALFLAVQFALGSGGGAFAGRDPSQWTEIGSAAVDGGWAQLQARVCATKGCEVALTLPKETWLKLRTACLRASKCFSGPRLSFTTQLSRPLSQQEPATVTLETLDNRRQILAFR
jgi:hypothetical protein